MSFVTPNDATSKTEFPWGSVCWMAGGVLGNARGMTLGRTVIKPGQANPRHIHRQCEEVLYLLTGRLEHSLGEERLVLEAGDTITIPVGTVHNARNIGDVDADMIVGFDSAERDFEPVDE